MTNGILVKAIHSRLSDFGVDWLKVESLAIQSSERAIIATVSLDGESEHVEVTMLYRLGDSALHIEEVETSRSWMTKAMELILAERGNEFPLKGMKGMMVRALL